jgi:SAM-dependent methyltransferase
MSHDAFTQAKWDELWDDVHTVYDPSVEPQLRDSLALITRFWAQPTGRFLEAGCGPAANALNLALRGVEVVGLDLSTNALRAARTEFARRGLAGEFVPGGVRRMPFADETFDFVYAGGVVEHFRELDQALAELARVLRPGGRLLITVPAFTLAYPYLFLRGNVPAIPVVEDLVGLIHFRLFRGKLASFGYERSFLRRRVADVLARAGLGSIEVARFDTYLPLLQLPGVLRKVARRLARTDAFAPMYYGTGVREWSVPQVLTQ